MIKAFTISALAATMLPLSAIDISPLTYNKNIWQLSPEQLTSRFPAYDWTSDGEGIRKSGVDDLQFMGMTIQSASLRGSDSKTDAIELSIYDKNDGENIATPAFNHATVTWKQHIDQATGKVGRRLPIVNAEGSSIQRTAWQFHDSVAVLTATRSSTPENLTLTILSRQAAVAFLKPPRSNSSDGPIPADNKMLASFKGKTSVLSSGRFKKQNISGTPEYFLLYFSASW